eukprot:scaffold23382_cov115-Skeletonema_dohrnii-CCMP3373.AAC.3
MTLINTCGRIERVPVLTEVDQSVGRSNVEGRVSDVDTQQRFFYFFSSTSLTVDASKTNAGFLLSDVRQKFL